MTLGVILLVSACSEPASVATPSTQTQGAATQAQTAAPLTPDVLMRFNGQTITKNDFLQILAAQVPEERRKDFLTDEGRVRQLLANLYIIRQLALEAKEKPIDDDTKWMIAYQTDRVLMNARIKENLASQTQPDFLKLAEDSYKANPEKYKQPEKVSASHILISTEGRSDDEARALAEKVLAEVKAGKKSFSDLALEYSSDPSVKKNNGNLGSFAKGAMVPAFEEAAFALVKPGDISGVVKTPFGYHIIQLNEKSAAGLVPFDLIKDKLVKDQETTFRSDVQKRLLERVKSMQGIEVNQSAVSALVLQPVSESSTPAVQQPKEQSAPDKVEAK